MTEAYIIENINIARKSLEKFHMCIPKEKLCIECCYFPPFKEKTFYAQIYLVNGRYKANCAFTRYVDYFGLRSYSQSFIDIEAADKHPAIIGQIICKTINIDSDLVMSLQSLASEYRIPEKYETKRVTIDGISGWIKMFESGIEKSELFLINPEFSDKCANRILDKLRVISDLLFRSGYHKFDCYFDN